MKTNKLIKGFTLVELLVVLAIIGLLAAIGIPAILAAQRASRDTTRLKQLEAIRNSMADYFSKYGDEPEIYPTSNCSGTPSGSGTVYIASTGACSKRIEVILTDGYTVTLAPNNSCNNSPSTGKTIYYVKKNSEGIVSLCKERSGEEPLNYKQSNQLDK